MRLIHQQIHLTPANCLRHGLQSCHQLRSHRRRDFTRYPGFLAAGGVEGISEGSQPYAINAAAATNLPPGKFTLTREGKTLRLEWQANEPLEHLRVNREILLP